MPYPTEKDKELYRKDLNEFIAKTGDPGAIIIFDDPGFEKTKKELRRERKSQ